MAKNREVFADQVRLLVRILPYIAEETVFALKGGTAINFFIHDMPRLSVDIDLVYLPLEPRKEALSNIRAALTRISHRIEGSSPRVAVIDPPVARENELRVLVRDDQAQVKIELSPVLRGTVYQPEIHAISPAVEAEFGYAEIQTVSHADLYAGKICAALDRQHPRDLFDVKLLFENDGIDRQLMNAFLVYLISHNRPMSELLAPNAKDIAQLYETEFAAMTAASAPTLDELCQTRDKLFAGIHSALTGDDCAFLLSVKAGDPNWHLLNVASAQDFPAVKWKLQNIRKLKQDNPQKHQDQYKALEAALKTALKT